MLIVLWMTRNITDDIPGWGSLFKGRAGDGTASVSTTIHDADGLSILFHIYMSCV